MSKQVAAAELDRIATVVAAPVQNKVDRNFGLPSGLYHATVGCYVGFVALMATLFVNPELVLPLVIIVGSIVFGFGLTRAWARMNPANDTSALTWGQFANRGVQTLSGHLNATEAATQVLILPVLLMVWGLSIAVIVAFVK